MIKTDFSKVNSLFLPYPKEFRDESGALMNFFKKLIDLIPSEIEQFIIVNSENAKREVEEAYSNKNVKAVLVNGFEEIWLRDIMGFNTTSDKIILPNYKPDYCNYTYTSEYLKKIKTQVEEIICKTIKKEIVNIPITLDGGNLVTNGEICFVTDKILKDNSHDMGDIENIFKSSLGVKLIVVPSNPNDKLSHTDGYLNFLNKNNVCLPNYQNDLNFLKSDLNYIKALEEILLDQKLNITTIHDRPVDEIVFGSGETENGNSKGCLASARGIFVNFLILNNTIILPEYTIPSYKKRMNHNSINKETLLNLGYNVLAINCDELAKLGGSVHCCSFTN